jgi:endonuclease YncB( thermonuclease family)
MSINRQNITGSSPILVLLMMLLLMSIVAAGGSIPDIYGQNAPPNTTTGAIVDLFGNVTDSGQGVEEGEEDNDDGADRTNFLQSNDDDDSNDNKSSSSASISSSSPLSSSSSSSPSSPSPSSSAFTTSPASVMINEIELNPPGEYDEGKEWIELYNPSNDDRDINIGNFEISTASESATIKLPADAMIEAGKTYVIELKEQILSNTVDSLVLSNSAGDILDRTPSLVDRSDDDRTWQRVPDGNNEWQFVENTEGSTNGDDGSIDSDNPNTSQDNAQNIEGSTNKDPDTLSRLLDSVYSGSEQVKCRGSAGCIEGTVTRIVDGDTLYMEESNSSATYKVDLALIKAPSRNEEDMSAESTAFTRDLCLGSTVLVDEDDMLSTTSSTSSSSSDSDIVGVVYCSSTNLNSELLDNGYAEIKTEQCATSEFANEPWVKDHGC